MSNLKHKEYEDYAQYLQGATWDPRENLYVQEILNHMSHILAEDYIKRMKNASSDPTVLKGGDADMV